MRSRRNKNKILHVQLAHGILADWLDVVHNRTWDEPPRLGKDNFIRILRTPPCRLGSSLPCFPVVERSFILVSPLTVVGAMPLCLTWTTPPL